MREERQLFTDLTHQTKGQICIGCEQQPRTAWISNRWALRCGCYPDKPMMVKDNYIARRLGKLIADNTPEAALMVTQQQNVPVQAQGPGVVAMPPATTIEEYDREIALVQHVKSQMQEGRDYGLIPGTKSKALYEHGAETLRRAFRIVWKYRMLDKIEDFERGEFYYHVEAYQLLAPGLEGIGWEASAWSREKKFTGMEREMLHHNVRDRSIKRAFVALIRNITGASGDFDPDADVDPIQGSAKPVIICSEHGVPFTYIATQADGSPTKFGPYYKHSLPKSPKGHSVSEKKIAEFTQQEPEEEVEGE